VGDKGATQSNDASSASAAGNDTTSTQTASQSAGTMPAAPSVAPQQPSTAPASSDQTAANSVDQTATSTATTTQVVPVNVNAPISVGSVGDKGATQSNDASSASAAANDDHSTQTTTQSAPAGSGGSDKGWSPKGDKGPQGDKGPKGGSSSDQSASNSVDQSADSKAKTTQIVPVNVNAPISIGSVGDNGADQSNNASSASAAGNDNRSSQSTDQSAGGGRGSDQTASNSVDQSATSKAKTTQIVPVNVNVPISIGSVGDNGATQSNDASSASAAGNRNRSTQSIDQTGSSGTGKGRRGSSDQTASNAVEQTATSKAKTTQVLPVNVNAPFSFGSVQGGDRGCGEQGAGGAKQSNTATSWSWAGNRNRSTQTIHQSAPSGGDKGWTKTGEKEPKGPKSGGSSSQTASNGIDQISNAKGVTIQWFPVNVNDPFSFGSVGSDGADQSNDAESWSWAGNGNDSAQTIDQTGGDQGDGAPSCPPQPDCSVKPRS
jgi:hypothetical protein